MPKLRRALLSVSDKTKLEELAAALENAGVELIASGGTAKFLRDRGLEVTPVEDISGSPEAFGGRMKTLSFQICSGVLFRRGNEKDQEDARALGIRPIDCVVVNFYPFEKAAAQPGVTRQELIENIDIGGPTLVRAAAKNSPDVLVLTDPSQYVDVIRELEVGDVTSGTADLCAQRAWERVFEYDRAIYDQFRQSPTRFEHGADFEMKLRYGENPHQEGWLEVSSDSPVDWRRPLTDNPLSYNNIADLTSAYQLGTDLKKFQPNSSSVVIVKHQNPCGVASVPKDASSLKLLNQSAQLLALQKAWEGDPVSAFGGVLVFSDPLEEDTAKWLSEKFIELVAFPEGEDSSAAFLLLKERRKKLKAVRILRWEGLPRETVMSVPGGYLKQSPDSNLNEEFKGVTDREWPTEKTGAAQFGIYVTRVLKSNAIALVREDSEIPGAYQLVGAGQGQPNRVEALKKLALPRAKDLIKSSKRSLEEELKNLVMISDAFFPFRDTVDEAADAGLRFIVQPGGSRKDQDSIEACNEKGVTMAFTGLRHFKH